MDAPRIQYAKTEDGVSIAYWRLGAGVPLVMMQLPWMSHIEFEWNIPEARRFYERLAENCEVIRFDVRGCGLSDRQVARVGIDGYVDDLASVIGRLGRGPFVIMTSTDMFKAAVRFAVANPELVLGLVGSNAAVAPTAPNPLFETLWSVRDANWSSFCDMMATAGAPVGHPVTAYVTKLIEQASSLELHKAYTPLLHADVTDVLSKIEQPLMLIHNDWTRDGQRPSYNAEYLERTRQLTAALPNARLVVCHGEYAWYWTDSTADAITSFLEELAPKSSAREAQAEAGSTAVRTILFTDLADHTAMMQRLGDAKGREVLREHERITRETLAAHAGTEIKAMGDGFMASFGSAQKALECAIALQRAFSVELSSAHPEPVEGRAGHGAPSELLRLHIGVNAGEPIAEDDDLFGSSVILAARAASKATAGQILVTNVVRELVAGKGFAFADAGAFDMKGFDEPVRLYEVRWA